ncbi:MAG: metallophosphoesterase [Candidatus Woesearchaeota archaeon]|nr:metallophosphoesterase [Candidatus Woesearchaeota archaeon]
MKIFIVSDTHFCHNNIIEYSGRPFKTVEEMNEEMIKRWNNKVEKDDFVIHLGDFALGNKEEVVKIRDRLNGNIILLKGNHDNKSVRESGFLIVKGTLEIDNLIFSHNPLQKKDIPVGFINVHGHIHEKESVNGFNVSVEKTNYEPILLEDLKKLTFPNKHNS